MIAPMTFVVGLILGAGVVWQPTPLEQVLQDYNHIRIYEDGSYTAESRTGVREVGCIKAGLCND